jgi:hypothetical protein
MAKRYFINTPDNKTYYSDNPKDFEEDILDFYRENNEPINLFELESIIGSITGLKIFKVCSAGYSIELNGKTLDFYVEEA